MNRNGISSLEDNGICIPLSSPVYDLSESHEHDELQHYKGLEERLKNKYGKTGMLDKVVDILDNLPQCILDLPNLGDTVYGIFRQTKIIPLTITGITLSAKNEEELGYSTMHLMADNTGMEWYKTRKEAEKRLHPVNNNCE